MMLLRRGSLTRLCLGQPLALLHGGALRVRHFLIRNIYFKILFMIMRHICSINSGINKS